MIQSAAFDFAWQKEDINTVLPVSIAVISFIIYWFTTKSEKIKSYFFRKFNFDDASAYHITFLRIFWLSDNGIGIRDPVPYFHSGLFTLRLWVVI